MLKKALFVISFLGILAVFFTSFCFLNPYYLVDKSNKISSEDPTRIYQTDDGKWLKGVFFSEDWKNVSHIQPFHGTSLGTGTHWFWDGNDLTQDGGTIGIGKNRENGINSYAVQKWNIKQSMEWETSLTTGEFFNAIVRELEKNIYVAALQDSSTIYLYILNESGEITKHISFTLPYESSFDARSTSTPELEVWVASGSAYFFYKDVHDFHFAVLDTDFELHGPFDIDTDNKDLFALSTYYSSLEGAMIFAHDSVLYSFSPNGELLWSADSSENPCSAKQISNDLSGDLFVFGERGNNLCFYSLNSKTGEISDISFSSDMDSDEYVDSIMTDDGRFLVLSNCRIGHRESSCLTALDNRGEIYEKNLYHFLKVFKGSTLIASNDPRLFYVQGYQETGDPDYSSYWKQSVQFAVDDVGEMTFLARAEKIIQELKNNVIYIVELRWFGFD